MFHFLPKMIQLSSCIFRNFPQLWTSEVEQQHIKGALENMISILLEIQVI